MCTDYSVLVHSDSTVIDSVLEFISPETVEVYSGTESATQYLPFSSINELLFSLLLQVSDHTVLLPRSSYPPVSDI